MDKVAESIRGDMAPNSVFATEFCLLLNSDLRFCRFHLVSLC